MSSYVSEVARGGTTHTLKSLPRFGKNRTSGTTRQCLVSGVITTIVQCWEINSGSCPILNEGQTIIFGNYNSSLYCQSNSRFLQMLSQRRAFFCIPNHVFLLGVFDRVLIWRHAILYSYILWQPQFLVKQDRRSGFPNNCSRIVDLSYF
mgnify:CR=1 FL=1